MVLKDTRREKQVARGTIQHKICKDSILAASNNYLHNHKIL